MFELLNPRHVAARKLARIIAQKQPARPPPLAKTGREAEAVPNFDSLERLLDQELRKYGLSLG